MPAVAQYRFHPHKSMSNPTVKKLIDYCKEHDIVFNGYSPLGSPDFTTFKHDVGTSSLSRRFRKLLPHTTRRLRR